ncbi:hypothetical protein QA600_18620 [Natronococcus sp. A-GB1]|uniref:hypothetical protein n=1 Tax=Natronococcus sp. A-GB1 TaxID=3037648 RepID=UPI00241FDCDB|nr:hypothetical protein [Natronococcus sp. A-GB1]MDG5761348.1 hypothetical protein [Natronococcus sp. A-GB1]
MGRFLNGVAGLGVGFLIFMGTLPFGALGAISADLGNGEGAWLMAPVFFAFVLMVGSPLVFWILLPAKDLVKKLYRAVSSAE